MTNANDYNPINQAKPYFFTIENGIYTLYISKFFLMAVKNLNLGTAFTIAGEPLDTTWGYATDVVSPLGEYRYYDFYDNLSADSFRVINALLRALENFTPIPSPEDLASQEQLIFVNFD